VLRRFTLLAVLLVAACGGGGDDVDPEADQDAADAAIEAFIEEIEDDGFEAREDDSEDEDLEFESDECEQFQDAFGDDAVDTTTDDDTESGPFVSGDFDTEGGETQVEASAAFAEDAGQVEDVFALYADNDLPDCIAEAFEISFAQQEGLTVNDIDVDVLDAPDVGEQAFAFHADIELDAGGLVVPFSTTFAIARDGRAGANVSVTDIGEDAPGADVDDLLELLLEELTADR
jgi:hypothetical protein